MITYSLCILARLLAVVFNNTATIHRHELGCMSVTDVLGIIVLVFGGITLAVWYGRSREFGTGDDCESLRVYPQAKYQNIVISLLWASAYVRLSFCFQME